MAGVEFGSGIQVGVFLGSAIATLGAILLVAVRIAVYVG